jgi:aurora kinase
VISLCRVIPKRLSLHNAGSQPTRAVVVAALARPADTPSMSSVSVLSVAQQLAALDISKKLPTATSSSSTRPVHAKQPSQTNVTKLLSKFAAPNPFPASKTNISVSSLRHPVTTTTTTTTSDTQTHRTPTSPSAGKGATQTGIDIGRYDGGFEIDNEKRGEKVYGEAAEDLALDSSISRYVSP